MTAAAPRPAAVTFSPAMRVLIDAMAALNAIRHRVQMDHWSIMIEVLGEVLPHVKMTGDRWQDALISAAIQLHSAEPHRRAYNSRVGAYDDARKSAGELVMAADRDAAHAVRDFFLWRWSLSNEAWRATLATQGASK